MGMNGKGRKESKEPLQKESELWLSVALGDLKGKGADPSKDKTRKVCLR
jgi:hypothetical protein